MKTPGTSSLNLHPSRAAAAEGAAAASDQAALYAEWDQWENNALPGEHREIAVYRMKDCYERGITELDLSSMALRQLPQRLPAHLEELRVNNNQLTQLPPILPASLKMLEINNNSLTQLPETLPVSLQQLIVNNNQLRQLPETLPASLQILMVLNNQLAQLPPILPASLHELKANNNQLTQLPSRLPASLHGLRVSGNRLAQLPETLPASVHELEVDSNQLTQLPDQLPMSLALIEANDNQLTQLPQRLPSALQKLIVYNNQLTQLPETLPGALRILLVRNNRLTQLPQQLPASLERIEADNNQLTQLPLELPTALQVLNVSNNQLTWLPQTLPVSLTMIEATHNQLTQLPEAITTLSRNCWVLLENNPLAERTYQRIQALADDSRYQGPQIMFSMSANDPFPSLSSAPLPPEEIVARWYLPEQRATIAETWQAIVTEEDAPPFFRFLGRLADTVNSPYADFQHAVRAWLTLLSAAPALRHQTFMLAQGATASCEDRVSLTFSEMQKARVVHEVEAGHYDEQLSTLVSVAREMFRQECLTSIAREKVKTLYFVDEIEVYLAYQVKLREPLQLSSAVSEMRFFDVAHVTADDLEAAMLTVRSKENAQFPTWLSRWDPWEGVLQRLYQAPYESATARLHAALEAPFHARVQAALQALDMVGDEDAMRETGVQIMAAITDEIKLPLTQAFLAHHQLLNLLDPIWKV